MAINLWHELATGWHFPPLLDVLAFYNGWEDRKTYIYTKTPDEPIHLVKDIVNFGAVNP